MSIKIMKRAVFICLWITGDQYSIVLPILPPSSETTPKPNRNRFFKNPVA